MEQRDQKDPGHRDRENKLGTGNHPDPRALLGKIELFTNEVGKTFEGILESLERLQDDIKQLDQLKQVAVVAEQMLSGQMSSHVDLEAKGEVGRLVNAINQTLDNLQQLDKTVHQETGKVPELASHLDQITKETESATQQVLEKLDEMIEGSELQTNSLQTLKQLAAQRLEMDKEAKHGVDQFLEHLGSGEDREAVLQEALDFVALMGEQSRKHLSKSEEVMAAIEDANIQAENLMNYSFDIMNLLQFQDITRQKVSKVIGLLKEMQAGLYRLLGIFNIETETDDELVLTEEHKATQDRIFERDALSSDVEVVNVDQIIKDFQKSG
ncbi:Protein phosphatase CheZ [Sulfidibacter corallicola]|uniref:Methyl-accepting chemotaxis protein n=1 Tax=Sulfidibacter corallicola TaxID=2818388 RepID=A0A8A4TER5_SULCO|nr:HAMP domain-containing protein [Sulfidibacter corallicola]QTD48123.1 methyl-accepting chemotaxis protein [Sulfidibacter corallicola]